MRALPILFLYMHGAHDEHSLLSPGPVSKQLLNDPLSRKPILSTLEWQADFILDFSTMTARHDLHLCQKASAAIKTVGHDRHGKIVSTFARTPRPSHSSKDHQKLICSTPVGTAQR